ncbi:MAG: 50S ribosomal protein L23 [Puniceicoccales bacterium]|jgi:large subunit ribosomal protein L23|nr:50S ribosomal protein L23 [Puniceicoccales bacterium]
MSHFGILKEIMLTEKSNVLSADLNKYTFKVCSCATKHNIALAIEKIFNVKVKSVNVLNTSSKRRRARVKKARPGRTQAFKKAIVSLKDGDKIEVV